MNKKISVLVVDDSIYFRTLISNALIRDPEIDVVETASNAEEAEKKLSECNPDILTLDVEMPGMNGLEFLRVLLPKHPIPVIVVSGVDNVVFDALNAGAVDFVAKPEAATSRTSDFIQELRKKVKIASSAKLKSNKEISQNIASINDNNKNKEFHMDGIIAIGASTGGTEATSKILKVLPKNIPGIVITQHMPPKFTQMYAERLDRECKIKVKEAETGDIVLPGYAFIAPGKHQMSVYKKNGQYVIECEEGVKVNGHCPSVDVLFQSVSKCAGQNAIGIILTGMGADGAKGLLEMRNRGAYTIGQDEKSCVVYGMPMVAQNVGAVCKQVPLSSIPDVLLSALRK